MTDKALLFINGIPPKQLPDISCYEIVACTDGAFHYLIEMNFPLEKLNFISGDFDSIEKDELLQKSHKSTESGNVNYTLEIICTPDQNKTDFQKALDILQEKGINEVHVYGGSGGEMDHFLGNLTVAFIFKDQLKLTFFDESSTYYFIPKNFVLNDVKGKMISLFPFPFAENIQTKGLEWPLNKENLNLQNRIGTRNMASDDTVEISYGTGDLLIFVHH